MDFSDTDRAYMRLALKSAHQAALQGEVPVGAVLVHVPSHTVVGAKVIHEVIGCAHNQPITLHDPTAHAEVLALRQGAQRLSNYRLDECELYVTLEPCAMCAQAIMHARLRRVIFGALEPKTGAAGSVLNLFSYPELNHHTEVLSGLLAEESQAILQHFFAERRRLAKESNEPLPDTALRTPDERFTDVWKLWPEYQAGSTYEQSLPELQGLRLHSLDLGRHDSSSVWVGLHGYDAWWPQLRSWAHSKLVHDCRVLLPDLIGFGMSDKPKKVSWHDLHKHVTYLISWLKQKDVKKCWIHYNKQQRKLAERLKSEAPDLIMGISALDNKLLDPLPEQIQHAPYPDTGHEAAPKAWVINSWDH